MMGYLVGGRLASHSAAWLGIKSRTLERELVITGLVRRHPGLSGRRAGFVDLCAWPCHKTRCSVPGLSRPPHMSPVYAAYRLHSAVTA